MGDNKHVVEATFSTEELQLLKEAARRVHHQGDVMEFIRAAALNAARQIAQDFKPTHTPEERTWIYRRAETRGHVWTEAELRERGLPLYWCEDWVRQRVEAGATRLQIALECGYPETSVANFIRQKYGLTANIGRLGTKTREVIRQKVAAGASRQDVAREFGVAEGTVAVYSRDLLGQVERRFAEVVERVEVWPVQRMEIARLSFDGRGAAAADFVSKKVKRGWLTRISRGTYDLTPAGREVVSNYRAEQRPPVP